MLDHSLSAASYQNFVVGRNHRRFSPHSTRVAGTCFLLRCGLLPAVISALADWESNMVERYGRRVLLNPNIVEPFRFYNPKSMSTSYGAIGQGLSVELASEK